jgi:hypothetical protein
MAHISRVSEIRSGACRPLTHTKFKTENGIGTKACNPLGTA